MALFENTLILVLVAIVLLQVSRRLAIPYPTMLALAGVLVAALPWAPDIAIDPHLALALFIAPALLDAAYDFAPREARRFWLPLFALAAVAVVLTTAAVAWAGVAIAGLPLAAAIALGALVAPPDAAAATAMLGRFSLPRRTVTVLKGESLFNDAVALLIFSAAVVAATSTETSTVQMLGIAVAVPGGIAFGILLAGIYLIIAPYLAGTLGGRLFEFVGSFGTWIIAERLHLSAVMTMVAFAMTLARYGPERQSPHDRIHSYAIWEAVVFLLNVLAFLLMGLQARAIVLRHNLDDLWPALSFAGLVLLIAIVVRLAWVLCYNRVVNYWPRLVGPLTPPTLAQGILVGWCGMRGVLTLAAALALPMGFPGRDLILLCALAVVLGTLILQGLTLGPLITLLNFELDESFDESVTKTRLALLDAAIGDLAGNETDAAQNLRALYQADRATVEKGLHPRAVGEINDLRRDGIAAKRAKLAAMRRNGEIDDDVFHAVEEELDWIELAASPPDWVEIEEA
ncbi:cation:proton antiporter [Bosea sp. BK604]|uniref:cation:proton antiporter n=1 Tax=Bosea sp. BK604 TaxID=2512180 RepID=UPI001050948D|nr:cation:proton antiporter [Bosea sp. BK604]TCR70094.1 sodium/proton antiporter (CPA1 family) [Bosea sp. BK604]